MIHFVYGKSRNARVEFVRLGLVSIVTSVIDFSILIVLTEFLHLYYLLSAVIGFVIGQVWSYQMCQYWVFERYSKHGFSAFLTLSVIGLVVNTVLLWTMTEYASLHYILSKVVASFAGFLVLFFLRKRILFA